MPRYYRNIIVYLLSICTCFTYAQTISTFAGGGTSAFTDSIVATSTSIYDPMHIIVDSNNNVYFTQELGNRICKIDSNGLVFVIAGTGASGFSGDSGNAKLALLNQPGDLVFDQNGNILFADQENHRIRKIDINTNVIYTIAGNGMTGYSSDGIPATATMINTPNAIAVDNEHNIYYSDHSWRIRKIDTNGFVTTIAGNGTSGFWGDNVPATMANLWTVSGIVFDTKRNIYVTDEGNRRIRVIDSNCFIHNVAGNGLYSYNGEGVIDTNAQIAPTGPIKFDHSGNIFFADLPPNNRVRKIDTNQMVFTVAGNGIAGFYGDGGFADSAKFDGVNGIGIDKCVNIYVSDINNTRIRKVTFHPDCWPSEAPQLADNQLTIYPNPVLETLYIDNVKTNARYSLFNITGIIEQTGILQPGSNTLPIGQLPAGFYLLELVDGLGQKQVRRLIKE